jgi:transcriptional regulator with XRE-family HTH domain
VKVKNEFLPILRKEVSMTTGERIKELRLRRLLTQDDLAELAGLAPATLSRIENDLQNPNISTLKALTKALNVDVTEIVDFEKE